MKSAEAVPALHPDAASRYDDGDIDLIMQEEEQALDPNEGVTYPVGGEPWVTPEAYSEVAPEPEITPKEPEVVTFGRETLRGSKGLKHRTRELIFNSVSSIGVLKAETENGVATIKRPLLERKQKTEERKLKKYEHKAKSNMFAFRRVSYARKARWAKNRLNDASIRLIEHDQTFGSKSTDKDGKTIRKRGKVYEAQKIRYLERMRMLELQRNKLLEEQIIAHERKNRRKLKNAARKENLSQEQRAQLSQRIDQMPSLSTLRESVQKQLKKELDVRMQKAEKQVMESDRRWKWNQEDTKSQIDDDLASLDRAVNKSNKTTPYLEQDQTDDFLPELEDAAKKVMTDDETKG